MDGSEHALTRRATRFRNQLAGRYNLPVHTVDERLTSVEAEQTLRDSRGGRRDKGEIDRLAAELILQSWLDEHAP
jgi:putative Holliday junction resolvase